MDGVSHRQAIQKFRQTTYHTDMRVFINGAFDVLQVGHINLLLYARQLAGEGQLIVAIDEDEKIMADKGLNRPIFGVHERAKAILDLQLNGKPVVDRIEFFCTNLMLLHIIRRVMPDVIVKGSDWEGRNVVGSEHARVIFFPRSEYSSTDVINRVLEKHVAI